MNDLGHNRPPSQITFTNELTKILGAWLKDHPVVDGEEVARSGKLLLDRAKLCMKDIEDERKGRTGPLRLEIDLINDEYRTPKSILDSVRDELEERIRAWIKKEEEKRIQAAQEAQKRLNEAEKIARETAEREQEARSDAEVGVEVDIEAVARDSDTANQALARAERFAARAEVDTNVRLGGGFARAITSKAIHASEKTLVVTDPGQAVQEMGWSERILDAILSDARQYRRQFGRWPNGIEEI